MEISTALEKINQAISLTMDKAGFRAVMPEGASKGDSPVKKGINGVGEMLEYSSDFASVRLEWLDNKLKFNLSETTDGSGAFTDYSTVSTSLLEPDTADESDVSYIAGEISDTIMAKYCKPTVKQKTKAPKTISKAAAKSGSVYYDANTLASRLTASVFPEFREAYNANIEKYGEFLPEDFFAAGCADAIVNVIRLNDPVKMKKLFTLLNEIYLDATNETQSIIVVTILGRLNNDQQLLANCVDYMCDDLLGPVVRVNKYLASSRGKKATEQLKNPPPYKPKKAKKPSKLQAMLSGGSQPGSN